MFLCFVNPPLVTKTRLYQPRFEENMLLVIRRGENDCNIEHVEFLMECVQVRFEPGDGHYLLTTGYDNEAKLWSARDFRPLRVLTGHEGKVMNGDICPDGSGLLATVGYDRTLKLWAPQESAYEPMEL